MQRRPANVQSWRSCVRRAAGAATSVMWVVMLVIVLRYFCMAPFAPDYGRNTTTVDLDVASPCLWVLVAPDPLAPVEELMALSNAESITRRSDRNHDGFNTADTPGRCRNTVWMFPSEAVHTTIRGRCPTCFPRSSPWSEFSSPPRASGPRRRWWFVADRVVLTRSGWWMYEAASAILHTATMMKTVELVSPFVLLHHSDVKLTSNVTALSAFMFDDVHQQTLQLSKVYLIPISAPSFAFRGWLEFEIRALRQALQGHRDENVTLVDTFSHHLIMGADTRVFVALVNRLRGLMQSLEHVALSVGPGSRFGDAWSLEGLFSVMLSDQERGEQQLLVAPMGDSLMSQIGAGWNTKSCRALMAEYMSSAHRESAHVLFLKPSHCRRPPHISSPRSTSLMEAVTINRRPITHWLNMRHGEAPAATQRELLSAIVPRDVVTTWSSWTAVPVAGSRRQLDKRDVYSTGDDYGSLRNKSGLILTVAINYGADVLLPFIESLALHRAPSTDAVVFVAHEEVENFRRIFAAPRICVHFLAWAATEPKAVSMRDSRPRQDGMVCSVSAVRCRPLLVGTYRRCTRRHVSSRSIHVAHGSSVINGTSGSGWRWLA